MLLTPNEKRQKRNIIRIGRQKAVEGRLPPGWFRVRNFRVESRNIKKRGWFCDAVQMLSSYLPAIA